MYGAVQAFLKRAEQLEDCHRIYQTMNFIDDYDGEWLHDEHGGMGSAPGNARAERIARRLPEKVVLETHAAD